MGTGGGFAPETAELHGRYSCDFVEDAAEVIGILEARAGGNVEERQVRIDEQGLCLANAAALDVLDDRVVCHFAENMREIVGADVNSPGDIHDFQICSIVQVNIGKSFLNQNIFLFCCRRSAFPHRIVDEMHDGAGCYIGCMIAMRMQKTLSDDGKECAKLASDGLTGNAGLDIFGQQGVFALVWQLQPAHRDAAIVGQFMQNEILIMENAAVVDDDITGLCMAEVIANDIGTVA